MDRMVKTTINGEVYLLNFSIEVMFLMNEKFGNLDKALDILAQDDKEGFETVRWFAVNMANDGELCRRATGFSHRQMLGIDDISMRISPMELNLLRADITAAIVKGYNRENKEEVEQEVDLGLAELESKKAEVRD